MNAKKTAVKKKPRKRLYSYRVWFKDGTDVIMQAEYPNQVYDLLPANISMKVESVVDVV